MTLANASPRAAPGKRAAGEEVGLRSAVGLGAAEGSEVAGDIMEAERLLRDALTLGRRLDDPAAVAWATLWLGRLAKLRGATGGARRQLLFLYDTYP